MTDLTHLPLGAGLAEYEAQAAMLREGHRAGVPEALALLHQLHPQFVHPERTWVPLPLEPGQIRDAPLTLDDMQLVVARAYGFRDWHSLRTLVTAVHTDGSPVRAFELAVEAVVDGDVEALDAMLRAHPELVHARSTRVTCNEPAVHGATLLHYLAANGVENHRQRSPANAVQVAHLLLARGADPNALAHLYGGECHVLGLLVSSSHPAEAGVQVPLLHALLDAGADIEGGAATAWRSPLRTALCFGYTEAARALALRGARVDTLVPAAGLGHADAVRALLDDASPSDRHEALAVACINAQLETARVLLEAGEDPDRYNPPGFHAHQTPLHGAAVDGNLPLVQLLLAHGARTDIPDTIWHATALGWAEHGEQDEVVAFLQSLD